MRNDKQKAIQLRKLGKSYNEITKTLDVPKSTLSTWLKDVKISLRVRQQISNNARESWAKSITDYNKKRAFLIKEKWQKFEEKTSKDINKLSLKELKLIGVALYWAEGHKKTRWTAMFCNSDPNMVRLIMRFFREVCLLPEEKLKPQVQIHPNVSEGKAKQYWSHITNLPIKQFRKTLKQTSKSSKNVRVKNTLPYGVFRIYISDVKLVHKIKGWIKGLIIQSVN